MALFDGQEALDDIKRVCRISAIENNDSVIIYIIRIEVGSFFWTVRHRYSEFYELNEKLIQQHNLEKSILPPKKLFGNHSDRFVRKRQSELEAYLQNVIEICQSKNQPLPVVLRKFLDFNRYEVRGITQTLSESFYHYGDSILAAGSLFTMTPLQLSSLTERLKLAEPTYDSEDKSKDLGHVLDFTSQLVRLHIEGSDGTIGQSNLVMNKLLFDLSCFKSVKELQVYNCDMKSLKGVGNLRSTLKQLIIKNSLHNIHDVLLCDVVFWPPDDETMSSSCWNCLESIQLRQNKIQQIDISMKLLKNVMTVDISHNLLSEVSNLETLPCLTNLNLSNNKIQYLDGLHTKLGNIRNLDLSSNHIVKLDGLSKLYSLESLNLSHNKIEELSEIQCLSTLPCLESLKLTNNPVTTAVDYRIKTLVFFASRISEITLDDKVATQKEKDTVAVIHAIKVSKEAKHENPLLNKPTKSTTHNVQLSSSDEQSSHDSAEFSGCAPKQYSSQVEIPTGILEFKHQVELIRKQGGDSWLRLLNTMRTIEKPEHDSRELLQDLSSNQNEMLMPDLSSFHTDCLENLDSVNDTSADVELILWCIIVSSYAGGCLCKIPVCIIFTADVIFIMSVIDLPEGDVPELKIFSKVSSSQLQAVSRSFYFFYIKLSIFSDSSTVYHNFLLLNDINECQKLIDCIQKLYCTTVQVEEDIYSSSNLRFEMGKKVKINDSIDCDILYQQRVAKNRCKASVKKPNFHWICLTKSHILLVEENLLFSNSSTVFQSHFAIHCAISIQCIVVNICINDVTKLSNVGEQVLRSEMPLNVPQLLFHYGYKLSIKFEGGFHLDVRFPTKEARDNFLELFTSIKTK